MLAALDELALAGELPATGEPVARLAAWYHDVAYDPRAAPGSNEHRSADRARDHLHRLGVPDDVVDAVEALVLMTADHTAAGAAAAEQAVLDAFHDADLWILSAPADRYAEYRRQVRAEYAHVPDNAFAAGRGHVLRRFADAQPLYRTARAQQAWASRARDNLAVELAALGAAARA